MLLRTEGIGKHYGEFCALRNINIDIPEGEFTSIIGPNGAGKTTLVNILTGHFKPDVGRVYFKGMDITDIKPEKRCKMGIARSFQLVNVFAGLSVQESLSVAIISRVGKTTKMSKTLSCDKKISDEALEIAHLFGLEDKKNVLSKNLPQGDKKLLDIASAFAIHPEIILLDEPTSGVSTAEKNKIIETLVSASKKIGIKSILQIEHDMDIVFSYSNRIIALAQGNVLADGTPEEIRKNEQVISMILGKAC